MRTELDERKISQAIRRGVDGYGRVDAASIRAEVLQCGIEIEVETLEAWIRPWRQNQGNGNGSSSKPAVTVSIDSSQLDELTAHLVLRIVNRHHEKIKTFESVQAQSTANDREPETHREDRETVLRNALFAVDSIHWARRMLESANHQAGQSTARPSDRVRIGNKRHRTYLLKSAPVILNPFFCGEVHLKIDYSAVNAVGLDLCRESGGKLRGSELVDLADRRECVFGSHGDNAWFPVRMRAALNSSLKKFQHSQKPMGVERLSSYINSLTDEKVREFFLANGDPTKFVSIYETCILVDAYHRFTEGSWEGGKLETTIRAPRALRELHRDAMVTIGAMDTIGRTGLFHPVPSASKMTPDRFLQLWNQYHGKLTYAIEIVSGIRFGDSKEQE